MNKSRRKEQESIKPPGWFEIETPNTVANPNIQQSLEVRIGSYVVIVPPRFDKTSFSEVCEVLLNL